MKKKLICLALFLAVILFLVSACVPMPKVYVCPDGSKVADPDMCPPTDEAADDIEVIITEPEDTETEEPEEPAEEQDQGTLKEIGEGAAVLLEKTDKVTGMKYNYDELMGEFPEHTYSVRGDLMKVELQNRQWKTQDEPYDTVYIDMESFTATGYCEHNDPQICPEPDQEVDVEAEDYYKPTPLEWLSRIEGAELTGRSRKIGGRNALEMSFSTDTEQGTMWLDSFFGLPLEIEYNGNKLLFSNMYVNQLKLEDVTHQPRT